MAHSSLLGVVIPERIRTRLAEQERFNLETAVEEQIFVEPTPIRKCTQCHKLVEVRMRALREVTLFKCARCRLPKYMRKLK